MVAIPVEDDPSSSLPSDIIGIAKRSNWASKNPGPILVFCIVFVVGMGLVLLFSYRFMLSRKAARQAYEEE